MVTSLTPDCIMSDLVISDPGVTDDRVVRAGVSVT